MQWVLVIVTSITAGLICWQAWETRRAAQAAADSVGEIKRQADIMESQKEILEKSVKAAEDNASAAKSGAEAANKNVEIFISKERAKLTVVPKPLSLVPAFPDIPSAYVVKFDVSIYGETRADVLDSGCVAYIVPLESIEEPGLGSGVMLHMSRLSKIITPNTPPQEQWSLLFPLSGPDHALLIEIKESRWAVGLRGFIKYRDVFDRERFTNFRLKWQYSTIPVPPGSERPGSWYISGAPEENQET